MDRKAIFAIRAAFHKIHSRRSVQEAAGELLAMDEAPREIRELAAFVRGTRRGVLPSVRFLERSSNGDEE
jgi:acyl-[acyl carrier protein]--UDP-N-acetylglucosamine O-acyltransferase